ncbi:DUF1697 domain-containing protein [Cohnella lupini]|uniref:Uncharacterized protein (DUF1697 family) n=1 Tax=Cohnella lupini TaxID=1294267 RepID=A0A3D9IWK6_9BACL|nr:DUF1697 domain-containing protein [Cohnella lupini]RED66198.1 uncharacterized protein (DUF1697 family) [Cohnella lupini]
MITYIALLRGINVGGKMIKMDQLRQVFESLKLNNVRTYIQSGNVLFESQEDREQLIRSIEQAIEKSFFQVTVVLRTVKELEEVVSDTPYRVTDLAETDSLYVTFLAENPSAEAIDRCYSFKNEVDEFTIVDREVYILIHKSYGTSKFSNNFLESKLKVKATTRNWATVNKLISMGKE